ncbi:hypothetical protein H2200_007066 [Cladophialophora chaetospira]|uniref:Uncharacterized protein n=1 Tax=Cladophialophora chaetospira TaxID=386627 RepID=A0AA38X7N1_9EURO|nr:hypothetical protein H2200_007066 [Cladophialophora chaetospira]
MKFFATIIAALASASLIAAGALMPRSDQSANSELANLPIGCYSTGNAPDPATACGFDVDYCNGELNGDNCARFCHCNEKYEIVCDNKYMDGCSKKKMAEGCSLPGSVTNHWWCTCNPFSKEKRQEVDAGLKPATPVIPQWQAATHPPVLEDKRDDNMALYATCG